VIPDFLEHPVDPQVLAILEIPEDLEDLEFPENLDYPENPYYQWDL